MAPRFKRGGAGTPAIMSAPAPVVVPVENVGGVKGARAVPLPDKPPATDAASSEGVEAKKPRAKKAAASPEKTA